MFSLTQKEEEVMELIWQLGPCTPKEVQALYTKPVPNINTVATSFQSLERKGYLTHQKQGRGYLYIPIVEKKAYGESRFSHFINKYFNGDIKEIVSSFIRDERLSRAELLELLDELESNKVND